MIETLKKLIAGKKVMILGFGREGQSTYQMIRSISPNKLLTIADKESDHQKALLAASDDKNIQLNLSETYLEELINYDLIFKSPGIKIQNTKFKAGAILSSQTQLFLEVYASQTIGVTGTKGKSTTSSLIYHVLSNAGKNVVLVGNIGIPPFSAVQKINKDTTIVFELSAHQLEDLNTSPHVGVLLNIYEEHLDHFQSFDHYINSKAKIFNQSKNDHTLIYNMDQPELMQLIPKNIQSSGLGFSITYKEGANCFIKNDKIYLNITGFSIPIIKITDIKNLIGKHNLNNIMAALLACKKTGLSDEEYCNGLLSFKSLEHRLEYVGAFMGIHFYNDSISTIPEATIEAVKSLPDTDTLILGGFDRGINYDKLIRFLTSSNVRNFIFIGPAGKRMKTILERSGPTEKTILEASSFEDAFNHIIKVTQSGKICLLSPAAASYDTFMNFEERGKTYKKMARNL